MVWQYTEAFITIASMNLANLVNFYTQFLGKEPISLIPNVYAEFQLSGVRLGIFNLRQHTNLNLLPQLKVQ